MTNHITELPKLDDSPKSGEFAPEVSEIAPTAEEVAAGNALGLAIDIDDDEQGGEV